MTQGLARYAARRVLHRNRAAKLHLPQAGNQGDGRRERGAGDERQLPGIGQPRIDAHQQVGGINRGQVDGDGRQVGGRGQGDLQAARARSGATPMLGYGAWTSEGGKGDRAA